MEYIIFLLGALIGSLLTNLIIWFVDKPDGVLKIDHSDLKSDIYRIELDDLEHLSDKNMIILKVDNRAKLSQD